VATAIVTGAGRGLGLSLAGVLHERSYDVIGTVRHLDGADELGRRGARVMLLDVADPASIASFVAVLGDERIDLLVNNAGADGRAFGTGTSGGGPLDISIEAFTGQLATNALGPLLLTRALADRLARSDAGRVVNVSSHLGVPEVALRRGRDVGYSASKAALNAITAHLAKAFEPMGVVVVAVHPGWVRTSMGGPDALVDADDAARTLCDTVAGLTVQDAGRLLAATGEVFDPNP
jgi:NAD(P)-dependent dehydrogenase (short-subunit alcohol dehydrogenase family)